MTTTVSSALFGRDLLKDALEFLLVRRDAGLLRGFLKPLELFFRV